MNEEAPATAPAEEPAVRGPLAEIPLILRFALGLSDLTRERVGEVLSACTAVEARTKVGPKAVDAPFEAPLGAGDTAWGLLTEALRVVLETPGRARARGKRFGASVRRRAASFERLGKLADGVPGVPAAKRRLGAWGDRQRKQLDRWTELGRREREASRRLAFDALTVLRENTLAHVSESPDVKSVIRQQSEGIAVTAVSELREQTARADSLAERTVSRLLGRGRSRRTR